MRAIWKGAISFSLVNIPIALYPATRREELKFRLLRDQDLSPIDYKRVAEADGREVAWEHIVKGYEHEKGKFIVLKDEDFRRVDVEATQTVDIIDFVAQDEIDPMFFDKPYYLEPQKGGAKAYALLRESLRKTGKVGIAKVVIKSRQTPGRRQTLRQHPGPGIDALWRRTRQSHGTEDPRQSGRRNQRVGDGHRTGGEYDGSLGSGKIQRRLSFRAA